MEKVSFLKLRETFVTFPSKLQIYAILYHGRQFPMDLKYRGHVYFEPGRPHIVY